MVLRCVLGRLDTPSVQAGCLKRMAGGAQLVAIAMWVAAIIAPNLQTGAEPQHARQDERRRGACPDGATGLASDRLCYSGKHAGPGGRPWVSCSATS